MKRLFRIQLRTRDVEAARAFYAAVLRGSAFHVVQLHEEAVARGARPHWLGFLDVGDVDRAAAAFVQRGATQLGPKWVNPEGLEAAIVRDPGGALIALAKQPDRARAETAGARGADAHVIWHELNTVDVERAKANYKELFGWEFKEPFALEGVGVLQSFAWEHGGEPVGSMCDIAGRRGVHPHWLFHLRVAAFEPAANAVREAGGVVVASVTLPSGDRVAICDDPQGAAFAIRENAGGAR
jgi:hypothetical protein